MNAGAFQRQREGTHFFDELQPIGEDLVSDGENVGGLLGRLRGLIHSEAEQGRLVVQTSGERRDGKRDTGRVLRA